jgi:pSer/pThr/pTyr-binding forkhead associated (FHA) protein
MQVKLRVIGGKNDGREIKIAVPKFVIGRGEEAHLRPSSDLISRAHCSLVVQNGSVTISDMGSRNGTYVNGKKLEAAHLAKSGDTLRVGRLQFEVIVDHAEPGQKRPKVEGVAEAAARTAAAAGNGMLDEDSITDWLTTGVDEGRKSLHETTQFSLDHTPTKMFIRSDELVDEAAKPASPEEISESDSKSGKKAKYKKLPPIPVAKAESSTCAADDVLRKFFNRR